MDQTQIDRLATLRAEEKKRDLTEAEKVELAELTGKETPAEKKAAEEKAKQEAQP